MEEKKNRMILLIYRLCILEPFFTPTLCDCKRKCLFCHNVVDTGTGCRCAIIYGYVDNSGCGYGDQSVNDIDYDYDDYDDYDDDDGDAS